jgi:hypothetical protein
VGDAAGEEPERFEAVGFDELLRRERHLVGIAKDHGHAARGAIGPEDGARRPHDRQGRGRRFRCASHGEQRIGADQRQWLVSGQRAIDGVVDRAAALAIHEAEDIATGLAADVFRGGVQQAQRGRVGQQDTAARVGHDHALGQHAKRALGED